MKYKPSENRYNDMQYNRCGNSGLLLPAISLGLWHNFGDVDDLSVSKKMIFKSFDMGITHFDLANNYGPPAGSAERNFGKILRQDLKGYRDQLIISSKAGYYMWSGPYGEWGSRKYLTASLDQSLKRMRLDYVDIFYSHRFDPNTPLDETMGALSDAVKQGKALYAGISNYGPEQTKSAISLLEKMGTPCLINQPKYSMLHREPEQGLLDTIRKVGIGCIPFSPLAQGLLSDKYLSDIPKDSRAGKKHGFLRKDAITPEILNAVKKLNDHAKGRSQTLSQMAIAWLLRDKRITSVLVGASSVKQIKENIGAIKNIDFDKEELQSIEAVLKTLE